MGIRNHKDLELYKVAVDFVTAIYKLTKTFPGDERFGLMSQMQRAAVSIPSNIAEGAARKNTKEFLQFLYYSLGSAAEIETQITIAKNLGYVKSTENLDGTLQYLIRMLTGLIKSLKKK